jgi:hypothetical protein
MENIMESDFAREKRKQRRCWLIGTDKPCCPECLERDWRCFTATSMPKCFNCAIKATKPDNDAAKRRRLKELRTDNPRCATCGESDWRCIELHHPVGRRHDPMTALVCANDHLRLTNEQKDHPAMAKDADVFFIALQNFLRGLADMLRLVADRLVKFADGIVERAPTLALPG